MSQLATPLPTTVRSLALPRALRPTRIADMRLAGALAVITLLGLLVRLVPVFYSNFPVNDGGMFYAMIKDLQANEFRPPAVTSYGGSGIPFAYPPLGFYLVAFLSSATHSSVLAWLRFLPAAVSVVTVPVMYPLARRLAPSRAAAGFSVLAFALLPNSFNWAVSGGGLTRVFGFLFAILALHQAHRLYHDRNAKAALPLGAFAGLCLLSHPLTAAWLAMSIVAFALAFSPLKFALTRSLLPGALALAVSAPWWVTVLIRYGPGPLLSAAQTGNMNSVSAVLNLTLFSYTKEPFFPLLAACALLGLVWSLVRHRYFLPVWLALMFFLTLRAAFHLSSVPLSILAGTGIAEVVLGKGLLAVRSEDFGSWWSRRSARMVAYAITGFSVFSAILAPQADNSNLRTLTPGSRQAAAWVAANTPTSSTVAVVTRDVAWGSDQLSEWFPALSRRQSLATVQGFEWMGVDRALQRQDAYDALQQCANQNEDCLAAWSARFGTTPDYVVVAKDPYTAFATSGDSVDACAGLRMALRASPHYQVAFENDAVVVFHHLTTATA